VIAGTEFKLKYSGSALGYVWSLVKPLGLFSVLYVVFGRFFKLDVGIVDYPLYLLVGIVLWTYFADATLLAMSSLVTRGTLLSKLSFPRVIIPLSVVVTAGITLAVNLLAVAAFVAVNKILPSLNWLLMIPLLVELFVLAFATSLILAPLFIRLRDIGQVWELVLQLLFYASPIIYPAGFLPPWSKPIAFLSPFVQVMQGFRNLILPESPATTAADVYGGWWGHLIPLAFTAGLLAVGLWFFRREAPRFAERL
jgi:ABC-2 type transport system permease protein